MGTFDRLRQTLRRIDGRGYRAYKDIRGRYQGGPFTLSIDYVQGDPFASPSHVRVRVDAQHAAFPEHLFATPVRNLAFVDFLARQVGRRLAKKSRGGGSGKSGLVAIDAGAQEVLRRSAVVVNGDFVEARLEVGLPARGRSVLGRQAERLLCEDLVDIAERSLLWQALDGNEAQKFVECVENQEHIRGLLGAKGLIAFVADGSVLPRESGVSDRPMKDAVPFVSPESLRVTVAVPNPVDGKSDLSGWGVQSGLTLIVGGGFHGKSTVLDAIERAVYPHVPGDGREYVVAVKDLVKIRAEDGRRVEGVDISAFINDLPHGRSTTEFRSDDASGSTSQAASIAEALEVGTSGLLLDEDTCATNFMIRDARMQALVEKSHEPITPFVDRVRELCDRGVSTVLVMGGCGDYFEAADTVVMMRQYEPIDVTARATEIANAQSSLRSSEALVPIGDQTPRVPHGSSFDARRGKRDTKISARGRDRIEYGTTSLDLSAVEQIVDASQTRAIGLALHLASRKWMDGQRSLREVLEGLFEDLGTEGLDVLDPRGEPIQRVAMPRLVDVAAAMNRLRTLRVSR